MSYPSIPFLAAPVKLRNTTACIFTLEIDDYEVTRIIKLSYCIFIISPSICHQTTIFRHYHIYTVTTETKYSTESSWVISFKRSRRTNTHTHRLKMIPASCLLLLVLVSLGLAHEPKGRLDGEPSASPEGRTKRDVSAQGLTEDEKDQILALHNTHRGNVSPSASNMVELVSLFIDAEQFFPASLRLAVYLLIASYFSCFLILLMTYFIWF